MSDHLASSTSPFVGDVFLALANEGRLILDPVQADAAIANLEHTLSTVRARLRIVKIWQEWPVGRTDELHEELTHGVIEAVFNDQVAPGWLESAVVELPKYIEALRRARRGHGGRERTR